MAKMSRLFPRSNSSFFLRSGNALDAKIVGPPRIATRDELVGAPKSDGPARFYNRVEFLSPSSRESPVKNQQLERCFVDLVTGDPRTKDRAVVRFSDMVGQNEAVGDCDQPLLLPRKRRAWMELSNMSRSHAKVKAPFSSGKCECLSCLHSRLLGYNVGARLMKNLLNTSCVGYRQCKSYCGKSKKAIVSPFYGSSRNYSGIQVGLSREILSGQHHPILQSSGLQHWFKNWQHLRKNKLTASTFGRAVGFWPGGRVKLWLEKLGAIEPFSGNLATCWSNIKEEEALERYKLITGSTVSYPEFQVYGKKSPEDNWLAASPDGAVDSFLYGLPSRGVLEIKCPFFGGDKIKSFPWKRVPMYYIPQAQGLMEILDRDWMDMYCWTVNGSSLFRLHRDVEYWEVLNIALSDFWWKHVQPAKVLYNRSGIKDPRVELRSLMPAPKHELHRHIVHESKFVVDNSKLLVREIHGNLIN